MYARKVAGRLVPAPVGTALAAPVLLGSSLAAAPRGPRMNAGGISCDDNGSTGSRLTATSSATSN
jgi:hypothetical protein